MTVWRVVGVLVCGALVVATLLQGRTGPEPPPTTARERVGVTGDVTAGVTRESVPLGRAGRVVAALRNWDRRRSDAWSAGDAGALRDLYRPGSTAGRADVRLLRAYAASGWRVRGLSTQVFTVRLLQRRGDTWTVRVVDRVAGGKLVRDGRSRPLPTTEVAARRVELVRAGDDWRVGRVRPG